VTPADTRTLPAITPENAAFWRGGESGRLLIARCADCGLYIHPPRPVCRNCLSRNVGPAHISGEGTIATYTVNHQAWRPGMRVPYVVAIVELDEQSGLRLTTNIVNVAPDAVRIGQRVRVVFERQDDVWLPFFEPIGRPGDTPAQETSNA
jgi:uncharacterized OB-fold protein